MVIQKNDLDWISVISRMEIEEYTKSQKIKPWLPKSPRHRTWHLLKYGDRQGYKGGWGPELIFFDPATELGYVRSTHRRAIEIRDWIRDNIFV